MTIQETEQYSKARLIPRRRFLQLLAIGTGGVLVSACGAPSPSQPPQVEREALTLAEAEKPKEPPSGRRELLVLEEMMEGGPTSSESDLFFDVPLAQFPETTVDGKLYPPVNNRQISKAFGVPVTYQPGGKHTGTDYGGFDGSSLFAVEDSLVEYVGWLYFDVPGKGRGPYAVILAWKTPDGQTLRAIYSHNRKAEVKVGKQVERGQKIGEMGSLGYSSGPHLHFEIYVGGKFTYDPAKPLIGGYFDNPEKYF